MIEIALPEIGRHPENFWRLSELSRGVKPVYWRGFLGKPAPDLSDCLAATLPGRPWLLQLWEPLRTKAPSPARCQPYCCYSHTVIFYHRPYITRGPSPWKCNGRWTWLERRGFVEFDKIETRICWDDHVVFNDSTFEVGGGRVMWHHRHWWMHRTARRIDVRGIA